MAMISRLCSAAWTYLVCWVFMLNFVKTIFLFFVKYKLRSRNCAGETKLLLLRGVHLLLPLLLARGPVRCGGQELRPVQGEGGAAVQPQDRASAVFNPARLPVLTQLVEKFMKFCMGGTANVRSLFQFRIIKLGKISPGT